MTRKWLGLCAVVGLVLTAQTARADSVTEIINSGPDGAKKIVAVLGDGYGPNDQAKFNTDVDNFVKNGVFANDFYLENRNAFNVYRVNLISTDSGVTQGHWSGNTFIVDTQRNTALDYVWTGDWNHCWLQYGPNTGTRLTNALNTWVPNRDFTIVLLNQDSYGGCGGGGFAQVPRGITWPVLAHEMGHGVLGLGDEYSQLGTYTGGAFNGPPDSAVNVSTSLSRTTNYWHRFISPTIAIPTKFTAAMDSDKTVGIFEGGGTYTKGIRRPVNNCRMNSNTPEYCPVCYTAGKKILYNNLAHNFNDAVAGDFTGDGSSDLLIHNGQDLAIYQRNAGKKSISLLWTCNQVVPAAPGGTTWQPATHDQYFVGDFNGDGKSDVLVANLTDWSIPYVAILESTGTGLQCTSRYDGSLPGWSMTAGDKFFVGDMNGDGKSDIYVFNGANWSIAYVLQITSNGAGFNYQKRWDGSLPGWSMTSGDQLHVGDINGDGKADLYVWNGANWAFPYLLMVTSTGSDLSYVKRYDSTLPNWTMKPGDRYYVGDFNGDKKSDLYVANGVNWSYTYLAMIKSIGTGLAAVKRYDTGSAAAGLPGWEIRPHDQYFVADANHDGKDDLYVFNTQDWGPKYLGTLKATPTALSGSWSADWIGGQWHLGNADQILPCNYEGAAKGQPDIFIRNTEWLGMVRYSPTGFLFDRIYYHWIYTALYDSMPWSDGF